MADALRRAPDDRQLLLELGQIHLARQDWTPRRPGGGDPAPGRTTPRPRRWRRASRPRACAARAAPRTPRRRSRASPARTAATSGRWRIWCRATPTPATSPRRSATSTACSPRIPASVPGAAAARRARPDARRPRRRRGRLPRGGRRRPCPCRRRTRRSTASSPARAGPPRPRRCSTPGSPPLPDSAALGFAKAGLLEREGRHRRGDRRLRGALCPGQRLAGARQQPREPDRQLPRRPGEPRARLRHRPAAARHRRALLPGHLRLDPAPPRRQRPGAAATSPPPPRRCPTTRWCSSTSPRPSWRSAGAARRARQLRRAQSPPPRPGAPCRSSTRCASASPRSTRRPAAAPATDAAAGPCPGRARPGSGRAIKG